MTLSALYRGSPSPSRFKHSIASLGWLGLLQGSSGFVSEISLLMTVACESSSALPSLHSIGEGFSASSAEIRSPKWLSEVALVPHLACAVIRAIAF